MQTRMTGFNVTRGTALVAALALASVAPLAFAQSSNGQDEQQSGQQSGQTAQSTSDAGMQADEAKMKAETPEQSDLRSNDTSAQGIADLEARQAKDRAREQGLYGKQGQSDVRSNDTSAKGIAEQEAETAKDRAREQGLDKDQQKQEGDDGTP